MVYNKIMKNYNDFLGAVFEDICKEYLWQQLVEGKCSVNFVDIGRWWGTNPKTKTQEEIDEAVANGEYQIAVSTVQANDGSPIKFLEKFCTDNEGNVFSFSNESYDLLINKCLHVYEGADILSGLKAAERFLITDGVFYPLYISESYFVYRDKLKNAYPVSNVFDIDFTARVSNNAE